MRRGYWIGLVLVLLLSCTIVLGACGGTTTTTAGATTTEATATPVASTATTAGSTTPIKIGQILPLTGAVAAPAVGCLAAVKEEVAYINANGGVNGRQIDLIIEDDKSDVNSAVAAMTKMIEQSKVAAVLGPFDAFGASAARVVAEKAGMVDILNAPPSLEDIKNTTFKWSFQAAAGADVCAAAELALLKAEGYKNVLAIGDNLTFDQETLGLVKQGAQALGITITAMSDTWGLEETDTGPIVAKIAAAAKNSKPDALLILCNVVHAPGIQKGLRALGIEQQIVGSSAAASPALFMQGPEAAEGMIVVGPGITNAMALPDGYPGKADMVAFATRYQAATKQPADFFAGVAYDALHQLVDAMKIAGADDPAKARDAIEGLKNWQGMQGIYNYTPTDHVGIHGGYAEWKVAGGTFTFVRDLTGSK